MKECKYLSYKTNGNANPQGCPRVFFCCHKKDFETCFEAVSEEILHIQTNAAIWYYDAAQGVPEREDLLSFLSEMQLFVVPVTAGFLLEDNDARQVEFAYALEHHIPVLPLMQEEGLDKTFNRVCGELQYLDKNESGKDPTAIPYEEKLKKFLQSVLVSDELAAKVRAAFHAYIFLSYRKKDRKYAQEIMRLIHENEFCRDIAIWYDEFLTPGENFNEAISEAMKKCSLFALTVTPNLLEVPNYVMNVEYPAALQMGKPVLPIEAVQTDPEQMKDCYESIGEISNASNKQSIANKLTDILGNIVLRETADDAEHLFFIGLAYLAGIDVEIDHAAALRLISNAAEKGLPEAMAKLVSMYTNGVGVAMDFRAAIRWQRRYIKLLEQQEEDGIDTPELLGELKKLGKLWDRLGRRSEAKLCYERHLYYSLRRNEKNHSSETERDLSKSYVVLGDISQQERDYESAEGYYEKALEIRKRLAEETNSMEDRILLFVCSYKWGFLAEMKKEYQKAEECYLSLVSEAEEMVSELGTTDSGRNLGACYSALGRIRKTRGDLEAAQDYYNRWREVCEQLAKETNTVAAYRDLALSYTYLGSLSKSRKEYEESICFYEKAAELQKRLIEAVDTAEAEKDLSTGYCNLSLNYKRMGKLKKAKEYLDLAIDIDQKLAKETGSVEYRRGLSVDYCDMAALLGIAGKYEAAEMYMKKAVAIREKIAAKAGTPEAVSDLELYRQKLRKLEEYIASKTQKEG